jgi:hypothetical protein
VRDQRGRDHRGGDGEYRPRNHGLLHTAAAGDRRRRPRVLARRPRQQRAPVVRANGEELRDRDPCGDDRLHGDRDDLEHGRGGQGRGEDDPRCHQPRRDRGVRDLCGAARGGPVGASGPLRRAALPDAARAERGQGRVRRRPGARDRQAPEPGAPPACRRDLRGAARRHDPVHRHQCRNHRRLTTGVFDGTAPADARRAASTTSEVPHSLDWNCGIWRDRMRDADPRTGHVPRVHVRVRGDAVVHDRAHLGDPPTPDTAAARTALPRSGAIADRRPRAAAVRRGRRGRDVPRVRHRDRAARRGRRCGRRLAGDRGVRVHGLSPPAGPRPDDHDEGRDPPARDRDRGRVRVGATCPR